MGRNFVPRSVGYTTVYVSLIKGRALRAARQISKKNVMSKYSIDFFILNEIVSGLRTKYNLMNWTLALNRQVCVNVVLLIFRGKFSCK